MKNAVLAVVVGQFVVTIVGHVVADVGSSVIVAAVAVVVVLLWVWWMPVGGL